ncbi:MULTISPECIES: glycosyltransferase family 4 protein [unclassified Modestobacter]
MTTPEQERGPRLWLVEQFGHGGIGRYAVDVANLVGPVEETVVATTDGGPVDGLAGRSVVWFPRGSDSPVAKARAAAVGLLRAARSVRRGDVAWVPLGIRPGYERLLVEALRRGGARVVATVHNRAPHGSSGSSTAVVATARRAHAVVVHTDAMADWAAEHGLPAVRLPFPPPDIAPGAVAVGPEAARRVRDELGVPAAAVLVAFLGYLYPYKGPDVLLTALAEARRAQPALPVHVLMAGRPSPEQDLPELVRRLGIEGAVTLQPGWLEESRMAQLLSAADVLALPYRRIDNSGMAALGRRWQLPAVASELPLLRDTYGDAAVFVRPDDPAELARALTELPGRLAGLRDAAQRMGADDLETPYRAFVRESLAGT